MTDWLGKARRVERSVEGGLVDCDQKCLEKYAGVFAFLAPEGHVGGAERVPARVTIFVDDGVLKASLNDNEEEASLYVTLERPEEAFGKLQKALEVPEPDWRVWRSSKAKKKSKRS